MKTREELLAAAEALEWAVAELLSEREIDDIETRAIQLRAQASQVPEPEQEPVDRKTIQDALIYGHPPLYMVKELIKYANREGIYWIADAGLMVQQQAATIKEMRALLMRWSLLWVSTDLAEETNDCVERTKC